MTSKSRLYTLLALLVLAILATAGTAYKFKQPSFSTLPTPAQWSRAISTSTPQILAGKITALGSGSLTVMINLPPGLGSTSVTVGSSTAITKNTPKSAAEMAAAFKEFQKEQAAAGGKPFTAPSASNITTLSFRDLKAGDSVLITLTPGSTKNSFTAQSIEVVPAQQGGTVTTAPSVPALPALPVASPTSTLH